MKKQIIVILFLIFTGLQFSTAFAQQRFPKPEFESGHTQPPTHMPDARAPFLEYLDIVVLLASLSIVTWLVLKKRSRLGVFWMSLFSIAYFGFFREGCVCSVGSIQNIVLAIFNPGYHIPISVIVFFAAPLIFSLFYGRTFCAAVCPCAGGTRLLCAQPHGRIERAHPWPRAKNDLAQTTGAQVVAVYD